MNYNNTHAAWLKKTIILSTIFILTIIINTILAININNNDNIIFTKTGNVQDLRKSIQFLFKNLKFREKIGENGRKLIDEHFNIINMKNKLLESFEDI